MHLWTSFSVSLQDSRYQLQDNIILEDKKFFKETQQKSSNEYNMKLTQRGPLLNAPSNVTFEGAGGGFVFTRNSTMYLGL